MCSLSHNVIIIIINKQQIITQQIVLGKNNRTHLISVFVLYEKNGNSEKITENTINIKKIK